MFRRRILRTGGLNELTVDRLFSSILYRNIHLADYEKIRDGMSLLDTRYRAIYREVFGRKIGDDQGPRVLHHGRLHEGPCQDMIRHEAARFLDGGEPCGAEAAMAKHLASEAGWAAANACLDTHSFLDAYDVE